MQVNFLSVTYKNAQIYEFSDLSAEHGPKFMGLTF